MRNPRAGQDDPVGAHRVKAIFTRTQDGLRPASDEAVRVVMQYEIGDEVLIEHKRGRSAANHRRFFAFVNTTFDWQDTYADREIWRKVLEMQGGHFDVVVDLKGNTHYWPKSIAWDELDDEQEFRDLFNRVVQGYLNKYAGNLSAQQLDMVARF